MDRNKHRIKLPEGKDFAKLLLIIGLFITIPCLLYYMLPEVGLIGVGLVTGICILFWSLLVYAHHMWEDY